MTVHLDDVHTPPRAESLGESPPLPAELIAILHERSTFWRAWWTPGTGHA